MEAFASARGVGEGPAEARLMAGFAALEAASAAATAEAEARGQRLLQIADAAPNGWVVVDADGRIERLNAAALTLLGLRAAPVGRTPLEGLHAAAVIDVIDLVRATGSRVEERDFVLGDRDLAVSAHPLAGGALAIVRDVGAERALDRARTDFVANASHEMRTPIAAILGFAETLLATPGGLAPDVDQMGRTIQRNAHRLKALFDDLLMLHQLEARRRSPEAKTADLSKLVRVATFPSRDAAMAKGIGFEVAVPATCEVRVSPEAITTILANLAGNAVKYTPIGGRIRVSITELDEEVQVAIADTGPGIARQHHARIFERFYRVDDGRAREVGGTGLGLAIVKHLADASGCRVSVRSDEGEGATFVVHVRRSTAVRPNRTWESTLLEGTADPSDMGAIVPERSPD